MDFLDGPSMVGGGEGEKAIDGGGASERDADGVAVRSVGEGVIFNGEEGDSK